MHLILEADREYPWGSKRNTFLRSALGHKQTFPAIGIGILDVSIKFPVQRHRELPHKPRYIKVNSKGPGDRSLKN